MQKHYFLGAFMVFLVGFSTCFGQSSKDGSLVVNGKVLKGEISIDHDIKTITRRADGAEWTFNFGEVASVILGDEKYIVQESISSGYVLLSPLVTGSATLYQDPKKDVFINTESQGLRKLNLRNTSIRGELLLYFSDCLPVRDRINQLSRIKLSTVIELTNAYNKCSYSEEFAFSEEELKRLETGPADAYALFIGAGYYSQSLEMNLQSGKETMGGFLLNAGIKARPSFLQAIQKNLFLTASIDYLTTAETTFSTISLSSQSYKILAGVYYDFNTAEIWKPYIGVKGGISSSSYDLIFSASANGQVPESDASVESHSFVVEPEIGISYQLNEKNALNLSLTYFPRKISQFSDSQFLSLPLTIEKSGFSATVQYQFL